MAVKRRLPSPRVAIIGFDAEEAGALAGLVASPLIAKDAYSLRRPFDEIDLAVVQGSVVSVPPDVPVLYRGNKWSFSYSSSVHVDEWQRAVVDVQQTSAKELQSASPAWGLEDLVDDLIGTFPHDDPYVKAVARGNAAGAVHPFVTNPRGEILAMEYERVAGAPAWFLPWHVGDLRSWLRKFLQRLAAWEPERVPNPPPDWEPWLTAEEQRLVDERRELMDEFEAVAADYQERFGTVTRSQQAAAERAATGIGRLFREDGEELKDAVADAVGRLGFEVTDADAELEEGEGKREDLRVEGNGGEILVEVKGYTKGARSNDLITAKEYVTTYLERTGNRPSRQWHIVNAFRGRPPELRERLFAGHDDMVASFAGLIIDTRDLFLLVREVEVGDLADYEARKLLLEAEPGLFEFPDQ